MYAVIVATEPHGASPTAGSYMHTCMSYESAFQTQGAHGLDNHEGPQSHHISSAADTPPCTTRLVL